MDLQELRDLIIVIFGIMGIFVLLVTLVVVLVVGLAARGLIGVLRGVVSTQLSPTLDSARQTMDDIRGTTAFITDTAVSPIIRVYAFVGGVRRGLASLLGLTLRRRRPKS
jgi:uncharacterized membrane protein